MFIWNCDNLGVFFLTGKRQGQHKVGGKWKHYNVNKVYLNEDQRQSERHEINSNAGTPPLTKDGKPDGSLPGYGSSGYTSDPTYNARPQMPGPWYNKAQPAHTSIGVRPKHVIHMPDNYPKTGEIPIPMAIPPHLRDYTMAATGNPILEHMGPRPSYMIFPGLLNRPQLMNGSRAMYMSAPSSHTFNGNLQTQSIASAANKPAFQGHASAAPPPHSANGVPQPNVMVNGTDTKAGVELSNSQRPPPVANIPTSTSTTVSVTTATPSVQPSPSVASQPSCMSCGCHSNPATYPYQVPQIPHQNFWHVPFSNGLLPVQMPHAYIPHHPFPPNGLNQDVMYPQYGLSHPGQPGVANGIPNLMYGYNFCNLYPNATNGRKAKKVVNCHNCGSSKHSAQDCTENSMESMAGELVTFGPQRNKTCPRGFRQSETQTSLLGYRNLQENWNFTCSKFR